ncbi:hypothetical protein N7532_008623 [Penicillium argentinense]|uniref:Nucleoporin Nup159/Nup146 N-terminal domain-containing protein n=1 Tax=Penicillium argentinense TaxID=1131581 RepID=A0A9W9K1S4_9EURO|nr:uncharacterized protein N7532_008623 [Penicillium argentinense]KAJ5089939.1 hypothetical protein N7532_008623 [Penicillium argentinense]
MAFNSGNSAPAGGSAQAELGPELSDAFTDEIGFKGVSGDANIRFLPTPWPDDALPAPTSSLLAVAQTKGLAVAAGPDVLVVATTESIRQAIQAPTGQEKLKTKPFEPLATIPLPARPTHIAFNASDDALILATENGSQISVFQTSSLVNETAQPALSVSTTGASIRSLVPNPDPTSNLVALVTVNGELLVADLKAGSLVSGANGQVLRNGVSCVAWSNKGKQLVAGLADGTADQMTADGTKKDQIPRPTDLEGEYHVSSVAWLENDVFFMVFTPNALEDEGGIPPSSYYIINRRKGAPFLIQKLPEICSTLGFSMKRTPAYQFITRLRDYKPHMKDVLIVSSTASADVSLVTRPDQPFADDDASKSLVGQFVATEINSDSHKAAVPLKDSTDDTSVIGLAADLTCTENVYAPIQGQEEDIPESSSPLPGLLLLNNDGILSSWWFIYNQAIREKVVYAGLGIVTHDQPATSTASAASPAPQKSGFGQASPAPQQPAFGQTSFGGASPFGTSGFNKSTGGTSFGTTSTMGATAFGKPSGPSFGSPSPMGGGSASAFGKPSAPGATFGTPSQPGSAFGTAGTPGQPAFGQSGFATAGSSFGQPSTSGKSLLGTGSGTAGGGFSSFSGGGGFAGFAAAKPGESPFAKPASESGFGKPSLPSPFGKPQNDASFAPASTNGNGNETKNPFGNPSTTTSFPQPTSTETKNPFGQNTGGFVLGSSFKPDGTAANDGPKPDKPSSGAFSFGGSFDEMVSSPGKASPSPPVSEPMDSGEDGTGFVPPVKNESTSVFGKPSSRTTCLSGNLTPLNAKSESTVETSKSNFSIFGGASNDAASAAQNQVTSPLSAPSDKTATPKREGSVSTPTFGSSYDTPLPPDPTSRDSYAPGDTSASSNVSKSSIEDAPLPPDFTGAKKSPQVNDAPLPPDFIAAKKPSPKIDDAPLPPDFTVKKPVPKDDEAPLPPDFIMPKPKKAESPPISAEEAPLPPDFVASKDKPEPAEEAVPVPDASDADSEGDGSDFSDSGEEITHDETKIPSPKDSAESSFSAISEKSATGGLFSGLSKSVAPKHGQQLPRQLFGEIPKQPLLPPPGPVAQNNREPYRSPSPTRVGSKKSTLLSQKPEVRKEAGSALATRKASLTQMAQRDGLLRKESLASQEEEARAKQTAQSQEEDVLFLSDDDEDERLREDLARPLEPVATLDPFLPHQSYTGETAKPGISGMVERLYRDINSMIDTLGINARSLDSYMLYQQSSKTSEPSELAEILKGDQPANILDKKLYLLDINNFEELVVALNETLHYARIQNVEEKLERCREILAKEVVNMRSQFSTIRKTLDAHTDTGSILAAPLSAEQATLQQDLRSTFADFQTKMADLEQGVSLLRAKMADIPRPDGSTTSSRKRPTVEAVASTISTMMAMAESKSSDIDVLESQMRKMGLDISSAAPSHEESPFTTPRKNAGRFPATPGSRGSIDGSAYHTPDSASRGINFRGSINGSARHSRLRSVEGVGPVIQEESARWKTKNSRRQQLIGNLKAAFEKKKDKVRPVDDDWVVVDKP